MNFRFTKHYTLEEARTLLPSVRQWLAEIAGLRERLAQVELRLKSLAASGQDVGGETVNSSVTLRAELQTLAQEFVKREIQVKDWERGLIDFPSLREGEEIFLCWEKDEDDIEHWHDLTSGYAGREPLD